MLNVYTNVKNHLKNTKNKISDLDKSNILFILTLAVVLSVICYMITKSKAYTIILLLLTTVALILYFIFNKNKDNKTTTVTTPTTSNETI